MCNFDLESQNWWQRARFVILRRSLITSALTTRAVLNFVLESQNLRDVINFDFKGQRLKSHVQFYSSI